MNNTARVPQPDGAASAPQPDGAASAPQPNDAATTPQSDSTASVPQPNDSASVLKHCSDEFAKSWEAYDQAAPLFKSAIDAAAVIGLDEHGKARLLLTQPSFEQLFGHGYVGESGDLFHNADRQDRLKLVDLCAQAAKGDEGRTIGISWLAGNGAYAQADVNFIRTLVSATHVGSVPDCDLFYLTLKDITVRDNAERTRSRMRLASALRTLFDETLALDLVTGVCEPVLTDGEPTSGGAASADATGDGSAGSDRHGQQTGYEPGLHQMHERVHPDDRQVFWKHTNHYYIESALFGEDPEPSISFDLRMRHADGTYHWARIFICAIDSTRGHNMALICSQNIDDEKDAQRRERELLSRAQTDTLTGLYNHGTTVELMQARLGALKGGEVALFAMIDVDDFKRVNDTYGHQKGDELLCGVADILHRFCREGDIAGRLGGDEFSLLFTGQGLPTADSMDERLRDCKRSVAEASAALGIDPPVTLSVGAVAARGSQHAYSDIIGRADSLMYEVKRTGKDGFKFEDLTAQETSTARGN